MILHEKIFKAYSLDVTYFSADYGRCVGKVTLMMELDMALKWMMIAVVGSGVSLEGPTFDEPADCVRKSIQTSVQVDNEVTDAILTLSAEKYSDETVVVASPVEKQFLNLLGDSDQKNKLSGLALEKFELISASEIEGPLRAKAICDAVRNSLSKLPQLDQSCDKFLSSFISLKEDQQVYEKFLQTPVYTCYPIIEE
jgi:hypothetical protein